jgi:hypothetical protein
MNVFNGRVRFRTDLVRFVVTLAQVYFRAERSSLFIIIPKLLHSLFYLRTNIIRRASGRSLRILKESIALSDIMDHCKCSHC